MFEGTKILSAPIQGITDCHWRNAHNDIFGGIDSYYSPFLRIDHGSMRKRDLSDVSPDNNTTPNFVPQILACKPNDAVTMATTLKEMGHREIDINLGCPFPPIALHHKGAGLLQYPAEVETIFKALGSIENVNYSVKMRLGWDNGKQWREIFPLFDIISPSQVTIHPRIGKQQYKGDLDLDELTDAIDQCHYPIVYNGEIKTIDDINHTKERFPKISAVMIGRGLIENPAMLCPEKASVENYRKFHERLYEAYNNQLNGGEHQLLMKMKTFWESFLPNAPHKALKMIKKASSLAKYNTAVTELFNSLN